jgi:Dolichyl-phosphate-mannose-protein mannosyltransferase
VAWALAALLIWTFALRAWAAGFDLTAERFWDERYGFQNVEALLATGSPRPANGFHPGLSYLPQAGLLAASEGLFQATGVEAFRVRRGGGLFTPTAYLLARWLQALFGTLSVLLTYLIGRRLFSSRVGLAAALLLSVVPWHIRQSVIFKPDILLVLTTLLAFWWSLRAAEQPTAGSYLKAGTGIGLALASKFNAGPIALPLAAAALAQALRGRGEGAGSRWWRPLLWLALAGAAALAVFLVLDPYAVLDPDLYRRSFGRTLRDYARKGEVAELSHLGVFLHGIGVLLGPAFHGRIVGVLGLVGLLGLGGLAVVAGRRGAGSTAAPAGRAGSENLRLGRVMLLVYVIGYALLYSLSTTNPSPHNWLPVSPFLALAAAWLAIALWDRLAAPLPARVRRPLGATAAAAAALLLAFPVAASTYRTEVPPTSRTAQLHLRRHLHPFALRLICTEPLGRRLVVKSGGRDKAAVWVAERFDRQPHAALDRCDAEVFPAARLEGDGKAFYASRLAHAGPARTARVSPRPLRTRGPELVILHHPWKEAAPAERLSLKPSGSVSLPALRPGEIVSLEILLPRGWTGPQPYLESGGARLALLGNGRRGGRERLITPRFAAAPGATVTLSSPGALRRARLFLHRWHPGPAPADPAPPSRVQ